MLIVYITISIYHSVKAIRIEKIFDNVTCKCIQCETIAPILDYQCIKVYQLMKDESIASYFICPNCQATYKTINDLPIYTYKEKII